MLAKLANTEKKEVLDKRRKRALAVWYDEQAAKAPACCENCGKSLAATIAFHPRAHVCHIVPKEHFRSVETHPWNRWFGCSDCHSFYDKKPADQVQLMFIIPIAKERFLKFENKIRLDERLRIPFYLKQ